MDFESLWKVTTLLEDPRETFLTSLVTGHVKGSEEEVENVKSLQHTDGQIDERRTLFDYVHSSNVWTKYGKPKL